MTHLNFFNRSSQDGHQQTIYFLGSVGCDPREGKILARPGIAPVGVNVAGPGAQFRFSYDQPENPTPAGDAAPTDEAAILFLQFINDTGAPLYFATSDNCEPSRLEVPPRSVSHPVRVLSDKPGIVVSNQPITDADAPAGAGA